MKADSPASSSEDAPSPTLTGDNRHSPSRAPNARRNSSAAGAVLPPRHTASQTRGWRQTFSSLKNRDYFFLWLGMMSMMGGMQMQMLARGYLVYEITGSASLLGFVSAGMAIPMLFLAPLGGAIADRVERKRLIQGGQFIVAILAVIVGVAIAMEQIQWYHLMAASILQGTVWTFMMPARQAIIPQIVGPDRIGNAMAINAAGMSAMTLLAPAIAGGLYALVGPDKVYFIIAGMTLLAVVLTTLVPKPSRSAVPGRKRDMLRDIGAGLVYIKGNSMVMVLLLMGLATTLLASPFRMLLPVFVVDIYNRGPDSMGLLVAIMGGGSLVGSLTIAALGNWRRGMLLILGTFVSGGALLLIAAFPLYYAAAAIMVLVGLGDAGRRTINMGLIMEVVEDQYRGRVMSVFMMNFGLMPLGVLPAGMIADALGGQMAIGLLGILLILVTLAVLLTQKRLRSFQ